jgi:hypothetical protein
MHEVIRVGKRILPIEFVALIEPFGQNPEAPIRTERDFKSRIVMLNRDSVLSELAPERLAEEHGFRMLEADGVATNPVIHFNIEEFEPGEKFRPSKGYRSRISWHDHDGNIQSKLLVAEPEIVLAVAVRGERLDASNLNEDQTTSERRPRPGSRRRLGSKR